VGDLGSSRLMIDTSSSFVGTPLYMAPEVLTQQPYSTESDIWSLGGLLYQLLTNDVPFFATNVHALQVRGSHPS
jgi:serine/threonine protein kinase